jgi:predicted HicB family RNase H-like nuclease
MAKLKNKRLVIQNVINKISMLEKKEISQLTIKIDKKINSALIILAKDLNISKNRLIENIIYESVLIEKTA